MLFGLTATPASLVDNIQISFRVVFHIRTKKQKGKKKNLDGKETEVLPQSFFSSVYFKT